MKQHDIARGGIDPPGQSGIHAVDLMGKVALVTAGRADGHDICALSSTRARGRIVLSRRAARSKRGRFARDARLRLGRRVSNQVDSVR